MALITDMQRRKELGSCGLVHGSRRAPAHPAIGTHQQHRHGARVIDRERIRDTPNVGVHRQCPATGLPLTYRPGHSTIDEPASRRPTRREHGDLVAPKLRVRRGDALEPGDPRIDHCLLFTPKRDHDQVGRTLEIIGQRSLSPFEVPCVEPREAPRHAVVGIRFGHGCSLASRRLIAVHLTYAAAWQLDA